MEHLVSELGSLLKMLDHETVSQATADQMASVRNILDSLQLSGTPMRGAACGPEACLQGRAQDVWEDEGIQIRG